MTSEKSCRKASFAPCDAVDALRGLLVVPARYLCTHEFDCATCGVVGRTDVALPFRCRRHGRAVGGGRLPPGTTAGDPRTAASSHHANDAYVRDLEAAYDAMAAVGGGGAGSGRGPSGGVAAGGSSSARRLTGPGGGAGRGSGVTAGAGGGVSAGASMSSVRRVGPPSGVGVVSVAAGVSSPWRRGPVDPAGRLVALSDRPIMCASLAPDSCTVAFGCSDHAGYVVDLHSGTAVATLFGRTAGHREWVTAVTHLNDGSGRIATAGMDGEIIIWESGGGRGELRTTHLSGHFGSISSLSCPGRPPVTGGAYAAALAAMDAAPTTLLVSTGYDKSVRLWDTAGRSGLGEWKGHGAPVLCHAVRPWLSSAGGEELVVASGDRDGVFKLWDGAAGREVLSLAGHKGHATAVAWMVPLAGVPPAPAAGATPAATAWASHPWNGDLLLTGAQDGHLRVWDVRARATAANVECHVTDAGAGAVGDIAVAHVPTGGGGAEALIVTAGADRTVAVCDPRRGFAPRFRFREHRDFIYSLHVAGPIALSGAGDGMLLAHDLVEGKPLWGLGANEAAVRCIVASSDGRHVVASGDDGKALVYDFA